MHGSQSKVQYSGAKTASEVDHEDLKDLKVLSACSSGV